MSIICNNLYKSYGSREVLKGLSLHIQSQEQVVITGSSGSGKSTLLYILGGLEKADQGEVEIMKLKPSELSDEELAQYRNQMVGFVFQFHFLLPTMTCYDNIFVPADIQGLKKSSLHNKIHELAKELGVEHCLRKYPYQISGGEQQRINIIRALSLSPRILLCDEPTGNLDSKNTDNVISLLQELAQQFQTTLCIVTHDANVSSRFQRKISIEDGVAIG